MTFTLRERDQVALKAVWSLMVDIVGTDPAYTHPSNLHRIYMYNVENGT